MILKFIRSPAFQTLLSKILICWIVYSTKFSIIKIFYFSSKLSDSASLLINAAIVDYIFDIIMIFAMNRYIYVHIDLKNIKTNENSTLFYRNGVNQQKINLFISVRAKKRLPLQILKKILKQCKIILKLNWSYDSWLSFEKVQGFLTTDYNERFYTQTNGLCIDIFNCISENELYAQIVNSMLLIQCDMGDKSEGQITYEIYVDGCSSFRKKLISIAISLWLQVEYKPHTIKIV